MGILEVAQSMRARIPWSVAQRIFQSAGLPRGQGWDKTLERLRNVDPAPFGVESEVEDALVEHYHCGEKTVRLFHVSSERRGAIREKLDRVKIGHSVFGDYFPLLVPVEKLPDEPLAPVLISVEKSDAGTTAVLASVRTISVREVLDRNSMPDSTTEELSAYDEIIGVRHIRHQAMDVLWIPAKEKFVELRIDSPRGFHKDAVVIAVEQTIQSVNKIVGEGNFDKPVNLFPLIHSIYSTPTEGTVVELAFGTSTASLKHEKMRRRRLDLRAEVYHKAGKQALGTAIEPHHLSVVWFIHSPQRESAPELSLNASARTAASSNAALYLAEIRNCTSESDYDFVRSRMIAHLP